MRLPTRYYKIFYKWKNNSKKTVVQMQNPENLIANNDEFVPSIILFLTWVLYRIQYNILVRIFPLIFKFYVLFLNIETHLHKSYYAIQLQATQSHQTRVKLCTSLSVPSTRTVYQIPFLDNTVRSISNPVTTLSEVYQIPLTTLLEVFPISRQHCQKYIQSREITVRSISNPLDTTVRSISNF